MSQPSYPIPAEDTRQRDPEWELVDQGIGTNGNIIVYWDPIHGYIKSEGPVTVVDRKIHPY